MTVNYALGGLTGQAVGYTNSASGARSSSALSAAYTYGSAGNVIGIRFNAIKASGIKKVYVFVDAVTGTAGNVVLKCEIRNEHTSTSTQPGSTLNKAGVTSTSTVSAGHWCEFDFSASPYVPAVGETIWLVLYNTAGAPATDFPSVLVANGIAMPPISLFPYQFQMYTTSNGFSSAGTVSQQRVCVVEYADGTIDGQPFTKSNAAFYSSNTRERGIVIDGLDVATYIYAFVFVAAMSANVSGIKIYGTGSAGGTQAPGGTALATYNLGSDTGQSRDRTIGSKVVTPILLSANTKYRVVFTYSANVAAPTILQIESASDFADTLLVGMYGNSIGYSTIDNGSGGWTDDKSAWGGIALAISSYSPAAGGCRLVNVNGGPDQ